MEALLACLGGEATEPARRCVAALLRGHVEATLAALPGVPPSAVASVLLAQWGLVHLVGGCLLVRGAGDVGKALAAHRTPLARRIAAWQGAVLACAAVHAFAAAALSALERPEAALAAAPALWVDVLTAFLVAPATAGRLARSLLLAGGGGVAGAAGGAVGESAARAAAAGAALAARVAYARGGAPPDERAYLPDERDDATPRPLARGPRKSSGGRSSPASSVASSQGRASPLDFDAAPRARPFRRYGSPVDLVPEGADAAAALARPCVGAEPVPEPLARGKDSPVDFGVALVAPVASRDASAPPPPWPETVGCGFDGVARSLR